MEITANCGGDVLISCPAKSEQDVQYRAISWYKVSDQGHLSGIVRWNLQSNLVSVYSGLKQSVGFPTGDGFTIELRNLTQQHLGVYRCTLWAPLGRQNREGDTRLTVTGCSTLADIFQDMKIFLQTDYKLLALFPSVIIVYVVYRCSFSRRFFLVTRSLVYLEGDEKGCISGPTDSPVFLGGGLKQGDYLITENDLTLFQKNADPKNIWLSFCPDFLSRRW
ncbi:uncharacterized protein [Lepisosteus oculatus]|uniref:uncharacterized protein n=1 Tax=Lepisosteus oculatus TaxID=7918 RepID=UPI003719C60F